MDNLLMACVSMALAALTVGWLIMVDAALGVTASSIASALYMRWISSAVDSYYAKKAAP